jgi:uncharacterized membrane protein YgdD (TMEM256/DUF423 family)
MNWRGIALIASLYGLSAVVLAALGAHLLPADRADAQTLWATALQMHIFHAGALLALAALTAHRDSTVLRWSGFMMALGVLFFCGSLYLRASGIEFLPGPLTPAGGIVLMLGWVLLFSGLIGRKPG